jgi:hypothetical protein
LVKPRIIESSMGHASPFKTGLLLGAAHIIKSGTRKILKQVNRTSLLLGHS